MGHNDEIRRFSNGRRGSLCSSRIVEIPVENFVFQSQIDTLQWQLKQTEASREMYRAVMKQVVSFLEKAHRSLELLGGRLNLNETVSRSKSEHQVNSTLDDTCTSLNTTLISEATDYSTFKDYTWRRQKKQPTPPDEIPPEKLSQEAFRLLRTAQSLLNTQEPDLAQMTKDSEDSKFLEQIAKEFPSSNSQRTSCFSLNTKVAKQDKEIKISTAFNRKLSLQLTPGDLRRSSFSKTNRISDSGSSTNSDCCILSLGDEFSLDGKFINVHKCNKNPEKSNSPPVSTISSLTDAESGFSSMNSFQEIGVPIVNSTFNDDFQKLNGNFDDFSSKKINGNSDDFSNKKDTSLIDFSSKRNSNLNFEDDFCSLKNANLTLNDDFCNKKSSNSITNDDFCNNKAAFNSFNGKTQFNSSFTNKVDQNNSSFNSKKDQNNFSNFGNISNCSDIASKHDQGNLSLTSSANKNSSFTNQNSSFKNQKSSLSNSNSSCSSQNSSFTNQSSSCTIKNASFTSQNASLTNQNSSFISQKSNFTNQNSSFTNEKLNFLNQNSSFASLDNSINNKNGQSPSNFAKFPIKKSQTSANFDLSNKNFVNESKPVPPSLDDIKLWQRGDQISHRRWSSTPAENLTEQNSLKVLWV